MNRKVLGKMKDELAGQLMTQAVGIGPKSYAYEYLTIDGNFKENRRCKGIGKSFTPKFYEYLDCVQGDAGNEVRKTCYRINLKKHELYTIRTDKVAMRNTVVKRVLDLTTKYETLPFGAEEILRRAPGSYRHF